MQNELMAIVAVVVLGGGLWVLLRYTSLGIAIRASAESADRAGLLGVNVGYIHSVVWMIAALFARATSTTGAVRSGAAPGGAPGGTGRIVSERTSLNPAPIRPTRTASPADVKV